MGQYAASLTTYHLNLQLKPDRFFSKMSRWIALLICLPVFFGQDTNADTISTGSTGVDQNGNDWVTINRVDDGVQTEYCKYTCFGSTCQMRYLGEDMGAVMGSCVEPGWSGNPCSGKPEKCQNCNVWWGAGAFSSNFLWQ